MLATTIDVGIPPAWNLAVMEIREEQPKTEPKTGLGHFARFPYSAGNALTTAMTHQPNSIEALGWTAAEALETYMRLRSFAENWDAPGMEVYDSPPVARDAVAEAFKPKSELGKRLLALRRAYVEKGGKLLDADALDRESRERRGGVPE